jgi:hypothetical protein
MNTDAKRRPRQRDRILTEGARQRQEEALDDALKNTFPASDPISIEQPGRRPDGSEQSPVGPLTEKK